MQPNLTQSEIERLVQALDTGAALGAGELDETRYWYLPVSGASAALLLRHAREQHHLDGVLKEGYVGLSAAMPIESIVVRCLTPIGDLARQALGVWLETHARIITPASMDATLGKGDYDFPIRLELMHQACDLLNALLPHVGIVAGANIADSGATWIDAGPLRLTLDAQRNWRVSRSDDEERAADRHLDRVVDAQLLLTELLPLLGIHSAATIEQYAIPSLLLGSVRAMPVKSGWKVDIDPNIPELMDLALPEDCGMDWNDVLDGCIDARNNWRPSAYLHVVHTALIIGTRAALIFISNYSDDGSPAPDEAVMELATALNRLPEWEAVVEAGTFKPAA